MRAARALVAATRSFAVGGGAETTGSDGSGASSTTNVGSDVRAGS